MDDETLIIDHVRIRALNRETRTDWVARGVPPELGPLLSEELVKDAERILGCSLHRFHRRLLAEVGNGGFGPGDGLLGVQGGRTDDAGRSVVELRQALFGDEIGQSIPKHVVPLWDWGDGVWACQDERTGHVLIVDESGITDTGFQLSSCMADWASGIELSQKLFTFVERVGINPFTKATTKALFRSHAIGTPYRES